MATCLRWILAFLAIAAPVALAQDAAINVYADGGIGLYQNLNRSNPSYNADAGADILYRRLFAEFEGGADTANAKEANDGYTIRTHALVYYRWKEHWSVGGGVRYSQFSSSSYKKHDLWPTAALLYDIHWLRLNSQYLFPGSNTDYHETGPLFDLRLKLTHGFYYRQRFALLHYENKLQSPSQSYWGRESTFGVLYVFRDRQ